MKRKFVFGLAVLMAVSCLADSRLVRGPYVQLLTESSAVIVWRTLGETKPVVRFGEGDAFDRQAIDVKTLAPDEMTSVYREVYQYEAQLTGLKSGTRYAYRIQDDETVLAAEPSLSLTTHPKAEEAHDFRMWVLGESGRAAGPQRLVYEAFQQWQEDNKMPLAGMLHLGGMAGKDGRNVEFQETFFDVYGDLLAGTVCWPVVGNEEAHVSSSRKQTGPYFDAYVLPKKGEAGGVPSGTEAYYSFDYGRVHFVMLDSTGKSLPADGPMTKWLAADLQASADRDFLVVCWHHAPYSQGTVDSDFYERSNRMRVTFMPMLEKAGVDLVLTSYSRVYERSGLINDAYNAQTIAERVMIDSGDGDPAGDGAYRKPKGLVPHQGTVAVVVGNGGKEVGMLDFHQAMVKRLPVFGSLVLERRGDLLSGKMIGYDGKVHDSFAIDKSGDFAPRKFRGEVALVDRGAGWHYDLNDAGGPEWYLPPEEDDWKLGQAGFGYGDGDDATNLGAKLLASLNSVRIRTAFNLEQVDSYAVYRLEVDYDDGFAAWLNGVEIARRNYPTDGSPRANHEAGIYESFHLPAELFRKGRNVLALEGVNATNKSTDFSLHPALFGTPAKAE